MLRPYREKVLNIANCLSEAIVTIIFILLVINQLKTFKSFESDVDDLMAELVNTIMAIQILAWVFIFARTMILRIKKCKQKNSVLPEETSPNIEANSNDKQEGQLF